MRRIDAGGFSENRPDFKAGQIKKDPSPRRPFSLSSVPADCCRRPRATHDIMSLIMFDYLDRLCSVVWTK
jgi:hypothetical protein